jgi:molybdopterin/thiamine biosynthesis adenylyltransferase
MLNFERQTGIVEPEKLAGLHVTLVGAGSVGSFTALALTKLGIEKLTVYDEDGVTAHNIPNQFYRVADGVGEPFKVEALKQILQEFNGVDIETHVEFYEEQPLTDIVIVATDSMTSRKTVWKQFLKQPQCKAYIEARMGGELGIVYTIRDKAADKEFYEEMLHSDGESEQLPCTARSIVYNVLMIASLICRAVKAVAKDEKFQRELVFDLGSMTFMDRE